MYATNLISSEGFKAVSVPAYDEFNSPVKPVLFKRFPCGRVCIVCKGWGYSTLCDIFCNDLVCESVHSFVVALLHNGYYIPDVTAIYSAFDVRYRRV